MKKIRLYCKNMCAIIIPLYVNKYSTSPFDKYVTSLGAGWCAML